MSALTSPTLTPPLRSANLRLPGLGGIWIITRYYRVMIFIGTRGNTHARIRENIMRSNNNNIMSGIICRKLLVKKPVKRIRCARVPIDRLFSGRAHQNHNIIYNPSIFGRRNICTAVPLINILS